MGEDREDVREQNIVCPICSHEHPTTLAIYTCWANQQTIAWQEFGMRCQEAVNAITVALEPLEQLAEEEAQRMHLRSLGKSDQRRG